MRRYVHKIGMSGSDPTTHAAMMAASGRTVARDHANHPIHRPRSTGKNSR
jgi:hypothetical protein